MVGDPYDGKTILRYVYDGDRCIAEYAGSGPVLRRKYVYGLGIDEPICMIEGAATSYYHFDALGSVIALTDANGDVEQEYEYSIWGQVGASDPNHSNRFMFTGREFDKETGLYYYRARYYHPEIGRFLQTDPIGYGDGMNWYAYCGNNPTATADPSGAVSYGFRKPGDSEYIALVRTNDDGTEDMWGATDIMGVVYDLAGRPGLVEEIFGKDYEKNAVGWNIAGNDRLDFWSLQVLMLLANDGEDRTGICNMIRKLDATKDREGDYLHITMTAMWKPEGYDSVDNLVKWDSYGVNHPPGVKPTWLQSHPLATLAHEIAHAYDDIVAWHDITRDRDHLTDRELRFTEVHAMRVENRVRHALFLVNPGSNNIYPRPGYFADADNPDGLTAAEAWKQYDESKLRYGERPN